MTIDPIREAARATLNAGLEDTRVLWLTVRTNPPSARELLHLVDVLPGVVRAAAALTAGTSEQVIRVRQFWS